MNNLEKRIQTLETQQAKTDDALLIISKAIQQTVDFNDNTFKMIKALSDGLDALEQKLK